MNCASCDRVRVAGEAEALRAARRRHAVDDLLRLLGAQRAHEHVAGVVRAAGGDEVAGDGHVVALFEHLALGLFAQLFELEDLEGQGLDLGLFEVLEHFGRDLGAHGDEQGGRLLATFQALVSDELGHG